MKALGFAKKDFYELIIDVMKRKKQITTKTMIIRALDTYTAKDEKDEIGQVFAMMCNHVDTDEVKDEDMGDFTDDDMR